MQQRIQILTTLFVSISLFGGFNQAVGKKAPNIEAVSSHIAFVLLEENSLPSPEALGASFKKYTCEKDSISVEKGEEPEREILTLTLPSGATAFVALMEAPVPNNEAEPYYDYSLSSLSNPGNAPKHVAHLTVLTFGIKNWKGSDLNL